MARAGNGFGRRAECVLEAMLPAIVASVYNGNRAPVLSSSMGKRISFVRLRAEFRLLECAHCKAHASRSCVRRMGGSPSKVAQQISVTPSQT